MKVCILITCEEHTFANATMTLDTIRVGFPTADVHVFCNDLTVGLFARVLERMPKDCSIHCIPVRIEHDEWIEREIRRCIDDTLILLDGDLIFWSSCEEWHFLHPLAGYYTPTHFNPWFHTTTSERLHTSFLWIRPEELIECIHASDGLFVPYPHYCEANYFSPRMVWNNGKPFMYDTCAQLYQAIGGSWFGDEHKNCYDHLNSASFYDAMVARFPEPYKSQFIHLHEECKRDPTSIRGLWRKIDALYLQWSALRPPYTDPRTSGKSLAGVEYSKGLTSAAACQTPCDTSALYRDRSRG